MNRVKQAIEGLPAPVRHSLAVFVGSLLAVFLGQVIAADGVSTLSWGSSLIESIDTACVATAGTILTLYVTPLTDAYGVGKKGKRDGK